MTQWLMAQDPPRKEDVDLWLVLTDPICAREYIADFEWIPHFGEKPAAIVTDSGRRIQLDEMTDEEAVVLATYLLRECQMLVVIAEFRLAEALGQVC